MKFHKVEVDSEVFQYVQAHAEPLVDTFNSALRRLLLVSDPKSDKPKHEDLSPPQSNGLLPNLSRQTPQAL
jgi:negative regulator of replication initiation